MSLVVFKNNFDDLDELTKIKFEQFLQAFPLRHLCIDIADIGNIGSLHSLLSTIDNSDTVYIASMCFEPKDDILHAISLICEYYMETGNERSLQHHLVLIEDLVRTERQYVYSNRESNFFRNFLSLKPKYATNVSLQITSSNKLRNSWGEGDCSIIQIPEIANCFDYWYKVKEDIVFHEMFNQGNAVPRLVSIQSTSNTLGRPLYRHPNDEEPPNIEMIPIVLQLKQLVEQYTGVCGINHVLIQHYRNGKDNIAAHSDKTLDIDLNTPIINLSFGSNRVMTIQNKQDKQRVEKIPLVNGECVMFGLKTNQFWFHEVAKDVLLPTHDVFGTERISFTFRKISTFITDDGIIVGQGSPYKTLADIPTNDANTMHTTTSQQSRADLIHAFSCENRQSADFDWQRVYGGGFLVR